MKNLIIVLFCTLLVTACSELPFFGSPADEAEEAPAAPTLEYNIESIDRDVQRYTYISQKTVRYDGKISFRLTNGDPNDSYLLIGKIRIEDSTGTDERDIFVLVENGRGEYEGALRIHSELGLNADEPELSASQVGVTIVGVVPLDAGTLSRRQSGLPSAPVAAAAPDEAAEKAK